MNLEQARSTVQGLRDLFKGLEKFDEVISTAIAADNLAVERQNLIDAKTIQLAEVTKQADDAKAAEAIRAQAAEQAYTLRLAEQQSQFDAIALSFGSVKAKLQAEIDAVTEQHATETTKLLDEIRELTTKRDELLTQRDEASAQLDALKNRIIGA